MSDDQHSNVVQLRPEVPEPYPVSIMEEVIRDLGNPGWPAILNYAFEHPSSEAARYIADLGPITDLRKLVVSWPHRNSNHGFKNVRTWKTVDDAANGRLRAVKFAKNAYFVPLVGAINRVIDGHPPILGFRYPASAEQRGTACVRLSGMRQRHGMHG